MKQATSLIKTPPLNYLDTDLSPYSYFMSPGPQKYFFNHKNTQPLTPKNTWEDIQCSRTKHKDPDSPDHSFKVLTLVIAQIFDITQLYGGTYGENYYWSLTSKYLGGKMLFYVRLNIVTNDAQFLFFFRMGLQI